MILRRPRPPRTERPALADITPAGRFVADVLATLAAQVDVGWNLLDIDAAAHAMIDEVGASSCYIDYHPRFGAYPFGKVICTSVNEAVLHGRPYDRVLVDGDLISMDFAVSLDGWVADSSVSVVVGDARPEDERLIRDTEDVMWAGIAQARAGSTVGDIGAAVSSRADQLGYAINHQFGGHGVGRTMHEQPFVPNHGTPGGGAPLLEGMVITVEPFLSPTTAELEITERDGWTVETVDGSRGAHAEHTLYITAGEPVVLTARDGEELPVGRRA
ncbi:MAG: type I methionyl aminopeptidase [Brachybacterium sp.]|nr:type I methionyl aminopeptidase [Brachybacterium sp.]